jgi:hypothetical protein
MTRIRSAQSVKSWLRGFLPSDGMIPADLASHLPFQLWKSFSAVGLRSRLAQQTKSTLAFLHLPQYSVTYAFALLLASGSSVQIFIKLGRESMGRAFVRRERLLM